MTQIFLPFDTVAIATVKKHDYRINFWLMAKSKEVANRIKHFDLSEKIRTMIVAK